MPEVTFPVVAVPEPVIWLLPDVPVTRNVLVDGLVKVLTYAAKTLNADVEATGPELPPPPPPQAASKEKAATVAAYLSFFSIIFQGAIELQIRPSYTYHFNIQSRDQTKFINTIVAVNYLRAPKPTTHRPVTRRLQMVLKSQYDAL